MSRGLVKMLFALSLVVSVRSLGAQSAKLDYSPAWSFLPTKYLAKPLLPTSQLSEIHHLNPLPKSWCYSELAIFCKLEVKMEKAAKFPIKFRLGSVDYVDRLEGKGSLY